MQHAFLITHHLLSETENLPTIGRGWAPATASDCPIIGLFPSSVVLRFAAGLVCGTNRKAPDLHARRSSRVCRRQAGESCAWRLRSPAVFVAANGGLYVVQRKGYLSLASPPSSQRMVRVAGRRLVGDLSHQLVSFGRGKNTILPNHLGLRRVFLHRLAVLSYQVRACLFVPVASTPCRETTRDKHQDRTHGNRGRT